MRKPMKSRMFSTSGEDSFTWYFDPEDWTGKGQIELWYKAWVKNGGKKIPLPK